MKSECCQFARNRWVLGLLVLLTMAGGLLLRSRYVSLPAGVVKYGGDALWALLVFLFLGWAFQRMTVCRIALMAWAFAWAIEFSQLYHAPWIDSIRAIRLGHLILGSTFNWPDLPSYLAGILVGVWIDCGVRRFSTQVTP